MSNWKNAIGKAAPLLGSLIAGPLGASAGQLLGKALLGDESASDIDIEKAILNPTPEQLIALKQIEVDLQNRISQAALEEKKLIIQDRDSARTREVQTHDRMPAMLAVLLTIGFFSILLSMMFFHVAPEAQQIINIMLGALSTAWISCITYYFGSSHGSQIKSQLLSDR